MIFDPEKDMAAIEGVVSELAALSDRPKGYPFSKIHLYSACPEMRKYYEFLELDNLEYHEAIELSQMKKLNFKLVGKLFGDKVPRIKKSLENGEDILTKFSLPSEALIISDRIPEAKEKTRRTTGCRKYLIEIESEECAEHWVAIQFRKMIKKYVTENLRINIVPLVFGDKYPECNEVCVPRVWCDLINCSESLYQALEIYGKQEFSYFPIRLNIPTRKQIYDGLDLSGSVIIDGVTFRIRI